MSLVPLLLFNFCLVVQVPDRRIGSDQRNRTFFKFLMALTDVEYTRQLEAFEIDNPRTNTGLQ